MNHECKEIKRKYFDCLSNNGFDTELLNSKAKYFLNSKRKLEVEDVDIKLSKKCGIESYKKCCLIIINLKLMKKSI